ncbi:glutamate 5-kinase [Desulfitispora alkaliphila]|uniref:glutamate 5-kinase n=1 Tax=Desulfitispora alkaliphila TaxID=622674 RepID=UPI003D254378
MKALGQETLASAKRIVIKVGTSSLTHENGKLNLLKIEKLTREIADIHNRGLEVILVSSGAIGAGMGKMGFVEKPKTIPEKQATAAIGQGILLHMYEKLFNEYGQVVSQVLLTREDLAARKRYLNARNALLTLIRWNTIPIINENDTLAVDEIRFGDNDTLAALVAGLVDADLLIILSDIDGLYSCDPRTNKDAERLRVVSEIDDKIVELAGGSGSDLGTGGMMTKILAAKIAINSGIPMIIANSSERGVLQQIVEGNIPGTLFVSKENKLHSRKRWIAYGSDISGRIVVDAGASKAIVLKGKSLLPIGIIDVQGQFEMGNVVCVIDTAGTELARGIVNYSSQEIKKIKGHNTQELEEILGYKDYDEVIHRDNLTVKV